MMMLHFDGWNVGCEDSFASTFLEFDSYDDAMEIYHIWNDWIKGN